MNDGLGWICVLAFVLGLLFGGLIGHTGSGNHWTREAIEVGAGQYNPTTGEFEWVTRGTEKGE